MTPAHIRFLADSSNSRAIRQAMLDWRHEVSQAQTRRALHPVARGRSGHE